MQSQSSSPPSASSAATPSAASSTGGTIVDEILAGRGARYGDFTDHARICQRLKLVIEAELSLQKQRPLPHIHKQALDVICDKIARIINGDESYVDNWDDIAGYAQLVSDRIRRSKIV